jgi:predicted transcriptional regulator
MTELLELAIATLRDLPDAEQEEAARMLLWAIESRRGEPIELDDETLAAIHEGLDQADRGEFASPAEMDAVWKRYGQ